ncbi:pheromone alpha factor receptor [Yamadazyma tenuis]|uniref:Pheromone alpha factor receptor n=1 Tax=Candida tenuis (strain ATCC 10573 / BCRC 21748 / CBS 615 / JCM 9827 / NBRC 10315 / NRRL Y-1498 / VKM Y-70) TaxID=590646 RepID=G3BD19_CANTC|nr:uncharacterized protein CANTEDRAFT_137362 [Yamadazyma tenuis ATCC 10573]EGV60897.1 hypothetical protein CANTEDRAFT_137362 [Yamadazyma tenuis ATCC 10573]WEJ93833.1 pheromone alpha factor receptor [Yamadazyma tenuis]
MDSYLLNHPGDISLNFALPLSDEVYTITFNDLDSQSSFSIQYLVIHSCAITVCLTLLVLLNLFIRNKKTPVFVLNQVILFFAIVRSSLFIGFMKSPLSTITASFTGIISDDQKHFYKVSVAANAALIILVMLIQVSFTYQIYIIFRSPEVRKFGVFMTSALGVLMAVTFGFYVNSAVASTKQYQHIFYSTDPYIMDSWVTGLPPILYSASVIAMSLVLVLKLVAAVRTRRYLGLKQFSSYHILLIMFTQTLFVPTILTILAYAFYGYNDILIHISTTITVVLLPFTSIWASIANNSRSLMSAASLYFSGSNSSLSELSSPSPSDNDTLNENVFAFFPDKLQKMNSSEAVSAVDKVVVHDHFDTISQKSIPHDILEILQGNEGGQMKEHISVYSDDSFSKTTPPIVGGNLLITNTDIGMK